jgi:hypothetical protein
MRLTRTTGFLRLIVFVAPAALVLHQARYAVGHGDGAAEALARDGHVHMGMALPVTLTVAVALAVVTLLLAAFARPRQTKAGRDPRERAIRCALLVLCAFCAQELIEGAVSASHPGGLEALLGHGGAAVLPLAVVFGCLVSLAVDALGAAEMHIAGSLAPRRLAALSPPHHTYPEPDVEQLAALGLVFGFARRPPPSPATR